MLLLARGLLLGNLLPKRVFHLLASNQVIHPRHQRQDAARPGLDLSLDQAPSIGRGGKSSCGFDDHYHGRLGEACGGFAYEIVALACLNWADSPGVNLAHGSCELEVCRSQLELDRLSNAHLARL